MADIVKGIPLNPDGTAEGFGQPLLVPVVRQGGWITGQIFNVDGGRIIR